MTPETGYSDAARLRYKTVLDLIREHSPKAVRIIEFGAAPGQQSLGLSRAGYDVVAVDLGDQSDAWDGAAEGTMASAFAAEGVELVVWDLERVPYPLEDESFDAVVMTEVFEHLRDYPATSLIEARRVLRPGGHLYLTTPNAAYVMNRLRLAYGLNTATSLPDWIAGVPFARHAREYTFSEMSVLLEYAGLEPVVMASRHFYLNSGQTSPLARFGKRLIDRVAVARPTLGPSLIAVGRRSE